MVDYITNLQRLETGEVLNSTILNKYKTDFAGILQNQLPYEEFFKNVSQGTDMVIMYVIWPKQPF